MTLDANASLVARVWGEQSICIKLISRRIPVIITFDYNMTTCMFGLTRGAIEAFT